MESFGFFILLLQKSQSERCNQIIRQFPIVTTPYKEQSPFLQGGTLWRDIPWVIPGMRRPGTGRIWRWSSCRDYCHTATSGSRKRRGSHLVLVVSVNIIQIYQIFNASFFIKCFNLPVRKYGNITAMQLMYTALQWFNSFPVMSLMFTCVRTSTAWSALASTKLLVENNPRSVKCRRKTC